VPTDFDSTRPEVCIFLEESVAQVSVFYKRNMLIFNTVLIYRNSEYSYIKKRETCDRTIQVSNVCKPEQLIIHCMKIYQLRPD
jgi:hypothetical protein